MDREKHDWAAYYRHAYEREKKKAAALAGKVYEAENKRDELRAKHDRITGSFVWRCLTPFRLARRAGRKLKHSASLVRISGTASGARIDPEQYQKILKAYREELSRQSDPYTEWLVQKASGLKADALSKCCVSAKEADQLCRVMTFRELESAVRESAVGEGRRKGLLPLQDGEEEPELILFAESAEALDADAPRLALSCMREHRDAVFWYGDEDYVICGTDGMKRRCNPYFKPAWSPETLLSFFYFGSYVGIKTSALRTVMQKYSWYEAGYSAKELLYKLCLLIVFADPGRITSESACMTKLVLYTGDYVPRYGQTADVSEVVLETTNSEDYAKYGNYWGYEQCFDNIKKEVLGLAGYLTEEIPAVSVIIPSKDNVAVLKACISSFLEKTDYAAQKVEFIVVDNGSTEQNRGQVEAYLSQMKAHPLVYSTRYLYEKAEFNFSAMCNAGAKAAEGELLLFLNDDVEILVDDWLRIMTGQMLFPGTGAVGAKLWYPECERIQHAGITNLAIGPSHKLITFPDDRLYYYGHGAMSMNMIAVTAACLLVKKSVYDELGGLNEELAVAYNDVEFCFRLLRNGYRNVQRNDAVLCHHESLSRGRDDMSDEKWDRLLAEKKKLYDLYPEYKGTDPYYSPYLSQNSPEYVTGYEYPFADRLLTMPCRKKMQWDKLQNRLSDRMQLTVERVLLQRKFHKEEPDIIMAEGWCYLPGADNALYEAYLMLHGDNGVVAEYPVNPRYRYDVCAILPHETNVGLAGFTCRVLKSDLAPGSYRAGLLYRHRLTGQELAAESALTVEV